MLTATDDLGASTGGDDLAAATDDLATAGGADMAKALLPSFGAPIPFNAGNTPYAIAAGDFDYDGHLDLAIILASGKAINILLGDGKGGFAVPMSQAMSSVSPYLAAGDFNFDSRVDLVVQNDDIPTHTQSIDVLLSNGNGTFAAPVTYLSCDTNQSTCANGFATAFAAGDIDGNGRPDVVISQAVVPAGGPITTQANIAVLLAQSNGGMLAFGPVATAGTMTNPGPVAVGDFDGDGNGDLAQDLFGTTHVVLVALSNGDGTFGAVSPVNLMTDTEKTSLAAGDFNNDGRIDLIGAGATFVVALGNGDGTFAAPLPSTIVTNRHSIAVADFNRDGKLDAVAATGGAGIVVAVGKGDGTFAPLMVPMKNKLPTAVVTGDFNNDKRPDIAVIDNNGVYLLLNTSP